MIETFTFVRTKGSPGTLWVTRPAQRALGRGVPGITVAAHGTRRLDMVLKPLEEESRVLPVSAALADYLGLVEGVPYRLKWAGASLLIGPVIGIHAAETLKPEHLRPGSLLYPYLLQYPNVGGLVCLFGTDGIDLKSETVEGVCWMPGEPDETLAERGAWQPGREISARAQAEAAAEANPLPPNPRMARFRGMADRFLADTPVPEPRGNWHGTPSLGGGRLVPGRFPFPAALWRRSVTMNREMRARLLGRLDGRLFNSHFFNKEEGDQLLAAHPAVREHLPATEPLSADLERLLQWLARHGRVLIKPTDSTSGFGILGVEAVEAGFLMQNRHADSAELLADAEALRQRLEPVIAGGSYLLQQWIDLPVYNGRRNDYRVIIQKDGTGTWGVAGILGRFGAPGAMLTNFMKHGYALPPDEAMCLAFGLTWREAHRLRERVSRFAVRVGEALDESGGCYGDLGLDIGIDREQQIWLFEANKRYNMELHLYAGLEQTYLRVKSGPLRYAAYLAGFES